MDTGTVVVLAIVVFCVLAAMYKPKRSRYIPKKSRDLAKARYIQQFYSDPKNKGKRPCLKGMEYDHYVPFSAGGTHDPDNIRLVPRKENRAKGAKDPQAADRIRTVLIISIVMFLLYLLFHR
ncbi:MAG: HNH endonuclease [Acidobacteria bacterium]|nr:HNH endonuclease [Acidobacteriota bacterium]